MKRFKQTSLSLLWLLLAASCAIRCSAKDLQVIVDLRKPVAMIDERFLSLSIDPATLLTGNASRYFERSVNLAKAFAPAYVRLAGPRGSVCSFNSRGGSSDGEEKGNVVLSETDLARVHKWAEKAGLETISCISPVDQQKKFQDPETLREIISFSDRMAFTTNWQLGYECQKRCNLSGSDLARQTLNLRKVLNEFPRYSSSAIIGPDIAAYRGEKQRKYLRDYFGIAGPTLTAVTWHPDGVAGVDSANGDVYIHGDNLREDRDELFKAVGRFIENHPLWIAESKMAKHKDLYIGALLLARRLGEAAKLNVQVVMRQTTDPTKPTPDFWVSLLHKNLVGREVFDAKLTATSVNRVHLYSQCTRASDRYKKGSVIIYGMNMGPERVGIDVKGIKLTTVHEYIITPGEDATNKMFAETVLLNNRSLSLTNDTVPNIDPAIFNDPNGMSLNLPASGIGFWVLPNLKTKSCEAPAESGPKKTSWSLVRVRAGRSVQDRESEKRKRRVPRRLNLRTEIRRLREFVRRRLDDYDSRSLLRIRGLSESTENAESLRTRSKEVTKAEQFQDGVQAKLREFDEQFSRMMHLSHGHELKARFEDAGERFIEDVKQLLTKVRGALEAAKRETDYENKIQSASSVKDYLTALYNLLLSTKLAEARLIEGTGSWKRSKRDLHSDPGPSRSGGWLSEESFKQQDPEERSGLVKGVAAGPAAVVRSYSSSQEDGFYGFLGTEASQDGFPDGDVPFDTVDLGPDERDQEDRGRSERRAKASREFDYGTADYGVYQPAEYTGIAVLPSSGSGINSDSAELLGSGGRMRYMVQKQKQDPATWRSLRERYEAGYAQSSRSPIGYPGGAWSYDSSRGPGQSRPGRTRMMGVQEWTRNGRGLGLAGLDFSIAASPSRFRRGSSKDLRAVLDQEMIDEDDANARDCDCRVIREPEDARKRRSKRDSSGSNSASVKAGARFRTIAEERPARIFMLARSRENPRDTEDVEVFADVTGPPMERLAWQARSSTPKYKRDTLPTTDGPEPSPGSREDGSWVKPMDAIGTYVDPNIPVLETRLEYSRNHKDLRSAAAASLEGAENEDERRSLGPKTAVRRDENGFFREQTNEEETRTDPAWTAAPGQDDPATQGSQTRDSTETMASEGSGEMPRADEASSTTVSAEQAVGDAAENVPADAGERETENRQPCPERSTEVGAANPGSNADDPKVGRRRLLRPIPRRRESALTRKLKTLRAIRELLRDLRRRRIEEAARKSRVASRLKAIELLRRRTERLRARARLRGRRQMSGERYHLAEGEDDGNVADWGNRDVADEEGSLTKEAVEREPEEVAGTGDGNVENLGKRNLRRREATIPVEDYLAKEEEEGGKVVDEINNKVENLEKRNLRRREATIPVEDYLAAEDEEEGKIADGITNKVENLEKRNLRKRETTMPVEDYLAKEEVEEEKVADGITNKMENLGKRNLRRREATIPVEDYLAAADEEEGKIADGITNKVENLGKRNLRKREATIPVEDSLAEEKEEKVADGVDSNVEELEKRNLRKKEATKSGQDNPAEEEEEEKEEAADRISDKVGDPENGKPVKKEVEQKEEQVEDSTQDSKMRNLERKEATTDSNYGQDVKDHLPGPSSNDGSPSNDDKKEERSVTKQVASATELVREENLRERIFDGKGRRKSRGSILEHPTPAELRKEIVELANLLADDVDSAEEDEGRTRTDRSYYALVEEPEKPRLFYHRTQRLKNDEKRSAQASSQRAYRRRDLEMPRYSAWSEEDETGSNEFTGEREVYIIDPSEYRGGEPVLHTYRDATAGSRSDLVLKPIPYRTYKIHRLSKRTRGEDAWREEYAGNHLSRSGAELLRFLLENLDADTAEELLVQLKAGKHYSRSVGEGSEAGQSESVESNGAKEVTESDADRARSGNGRADATDTIESFEAADVGYDGEEQGGHDSTEQGSSAMQEPIPYDIQEAEIRKRRDAASLSEEREQEDYAEWRGPRALSSSATQDNHLIPKDEPAARDENSSAVLEISRGNDFHETQVPAQARCDSVNDRRNGEGDKFANRGYRGSREPRKFASPFSRAGVEYSSDEGVANRYFDDSVKNGSETEGSRGSEYRDPSNTLELPVASERDSEESDGRTNPGELLLSNGAEVLMAMPGGKRRRRDAEDPEQSGESSNTEKVQTAELQHLEKSLSSETASFRPSDDIEKSLVEKIPLEKYKTRGDGINRRKSTRRNRKNEENLLSSLIEKSLPRLGNVVEDGLKKAQNLTSSVEHLIENLDVKYNETLSSDPRRGTVDPGSTGAVQNVFHGAIVNVKKFFMLLTGITHLLRT